MPKYEYKILDTSGRPVGGYTLEKLGEDGWLLIAIQFDTAYFVREKREEPVKEKKAGK